MKKGRLILFILILVTGLSITFADSFKSQNQVEIISSDRYTDVKQLISEKVYKYGASEVLVVLDIDNTILTSDVDLGSDIWYQWQRGKLEVKPTENQKVACLFEDAIGLLYELGTMHLTDTNLPTFINEWQSQNISLFALTSRSPRYRTATERELKKQGIDLTKTAIRPINDSLPVYRYNLKREMSYMKGVMMTSGMNKGEMLAHMLAKTDRSFSAVVFVDDSEKNVQALVSAFFESSMDFNIYHYTKVENDRKAINGGVILTQEQANSMSNDWDKLNNTLNTIFPNREGGCVSLD